MNGDYKKEILNFIEVVEKYIDDNIRDGSLKPDEEEFFQWKLNDAFAYGKEGIMKMSSSGHYFIKQTWMSPLIKQLEKIKSTPQYNGLLECLKRRYARKNINHFLFLFLYRFLEMKAEQLDGRLTLDRAKIAERFIDDLEDKPANYGALVYLAGVTLESERIEVKLSDGTTNIVLRQPTREAVEIEIPRPDLPLTNNSWSVRPSAILEISYSAGDCYDVAIRIGKIVSLLRLFRVGSVKATRYTTYTDSVANNTAGRISDRGSTYTDDDNFHATTFYCIDTTIEEKLKNFIYHIHQLSDKLFSFTKGETYLKIAFDKYNLSVLRNNPVEERISNAVAGLESLLLSNEQELSYKLSLFGTLLLSSFESDPNKVRETNKRCVQYPQ